jgi:hypothetical protein
LIKKERGVDVVEAFRELAPPAEPISIQRWSGRRLRLTVVSVLLGLFVLGIVVQELLGGGLL